MNRIMRFVRRRTKECAKWLPGEHEAWVAAGPRYIYDRETDTITITKPAAAAESEKP